MDESTASIARCLRAALANARRVPMALLFVSLGSTGTTQAALPLEAGAATAAAQSIDRLQPGLAGQVRQLALDASQQRPDAARRVQVSVGPLDPRLRLAPCQRIEPYLPAGTALWGKTRIGLRCTQGSTAWNVFLPVTVSVFGKAWVAAAPLPSGSVLAAGDLVQAEVDLAEDKGVITDAHLAVGRSLARALNTGQALRPSDLKTRQWFAAGDDVKIAARGNGFSVAGSGQALNHGLEGQPVRVRVESGRVLVGMPVGERLVELSP